MPPLPENPSFDLALGLVSALLMFAAALYLVRARSSASPGLPPLRYGKAESDDDLFAEFMPDDTARRLSLVGSLFLHVLFVALLPVVELLTPGPLLFDMNQYDVVLLQYQIRDRSLTLPSDLREAEPLKARNAPETPAEKDPLGLPDAKAERNTSRRGVRRKAPSSKSRWATRSRPNRR